MASLIDEIRQSDSRTGELIDKQVERLKLAMADRHVALVAKNCGIHKNTIHRILHDIGGRPTINTLEVLEAYLFPQEVDGKASSAAT